MICKVRYITVVGLDARLNRKQTASGVCDLQSCKAD